MKQPTALEEFKRHSWIIFFMFCIISMGFLVYSIHIYEVGLHNQDLGWNFKYISGVSYLDLKDMADDDNVYTPEELITMGARQRKAGFFDSILFSALFSFSLCALAYSCKYYRGKR